MQGKLDNPLSGICSLSSTLYLMLIDCFQFPLLCLYNNQHLKGTSAGSETVAKNGRWETEEKTNMSST